MAARPSVAPAFIPPYRRRRAGSELSGFTAATETIQRLNEGGKLQGRLVAEAAVLEEVLDLHSHLRGPQQRDVRYGQHDMIR